MGTFIGLDGLRPRFSRHEENGAMQINQACPRNQVPQEFNQLSSSCLTRHRLMSNTRDTESRLRYQARQRLGGEMVEVPFAKVESKKRFAQNFARAKLCPGDTWNLYDKNAFRFEDAPRGLQRSEGIKSMLQTVPKCDNVKVVVGKRHFLQIPALCS